MNIEILIFFGTNALYPPNARHVPIDPYGPRKAAKRWINAQGTGAK